ncbi:MAG: hypothetical protein M0P42_14430 [Gallionella sp.]|jgi:hypothetical protein|nr:hypothetical protein [Gallionella sp.]
MRLIDFSLSNIELEVGDSCFDLHNNFDFEGFSYGVANRSLAMKWKRGIGDWVPLGSPLEIEVKIEGVIHFSVTPRNPELPFSEDDCLNCVSFVEPDQPIDDCFITAVAPIPTELHYIFQFMSGLNIRVQAEEARCLVKWPNPSINPDAAR